MGPFLLLSGICACLAVAFAVSPLWRNSRALAIALAVALPLAAGGLYWLKGTPAALDEANRAPPATIEEAIVQLQHLTTADPGNYADMATLARAYMAKQDFENARKTFARALALKPEDASIFDQYAEALLRTSPDRRFPPLAVTLLQKALQKDPDNQRALFFYGLHQRQSGDPAGAVASWEKLLAQLDETSGSELRKQIAAARKEAGMPEAPAEATILVTIKLDPKLEQQARVGTILYVFARSSEGTGPPVAARRLAPNQFPIDVELGDADSPMPTAKLFSQKRIELMARLSMTGDAQQSSGDLEAEPLLLDVAPGAHAELTLSKSVP